AQPEIRWYSIDGGGGTSSGGRFTLVGTIGQHDAGPIMTGGRFTVVGGFHAIAMRICPADWTGDGTVNSADFFAFLADFFAGEGDFNHDGQTTSQDFFEYLTAFFSEC